MCSNVPHRCIVNVWSNNELLLFFPLALRISFKRPRFSDLWSIIRNMGMWGGKAKTNEPELKFFFKAKNVAIVLIFFLKSWNPRSYDCKSSQNLRLIGILVYTHFLSLLRYNLHIMKYTHFKCILQWVLVNLLLCNHHNPILQHSYHPTRIPHAHL